MDRRTWRIYVDSSVVSGVFDHHLPERVEQAKLFWESVADGKIRIVASDVLGKEQENAPHYVRDFFAALPESQIERVESTDESDALAERYIADGVVGETSLDDCKHIALATIHRAIVIFLQSPNMEFPMKKKSTSSARPMKNARPVSTSSKNSKIPVFTGMTRLWNKSILKMFISPAQLQC